jgi:hypothetical protein
MIDDTVKPASVVAVICCRTTTAKFYARLPFHNVNVRRKAAIQGATVHYQKVTMKPTYSQLLQLNPLLARKTPQEVEELIREIEECGYEWDHEQQIFYNSKISRGIRTQGLDLFTPDTFRKYHKEFENEFNINPQQWTLHAFGTSIWARWAPRLIVLFAINLVFGWLLIPLTYWLISLIAIIILFFFVKSFFVNATRPS